MYTCSCASSSLLNRLIVYLFSTVHVQLQAHSWVLVYVGVRCSGGPGFSWYTIITLEHFLLASTGFPWSRPWLS
jgi:hypothetical protein